MIASSSYPDWRWQSWLLPSALSSELFCTCHTSEIYLHTIVTLHFSHFSARSCCMATPLVYLVCIYIYIYSAELQPTMSVMLWLRMLTHTYTEGKPQWVLIWSSVSPKVLVQVAFCETITDYRGKWFITYREEGIFSILFNVHKSIHKHKYNAFPERRSGKYLDLLEQ